MRVLSVATLHGITECDFVHGTADGDVPGVLWTPADLSRPAPLVLLTHGGGQHKHAPGVVDRAARCVAAGLSVVALDAPRHGGRPLSAEDEAVAAEIRTRSWATATGWRGLRRTSRCRCGFCCSGTTGWWRARPGSRCPTRSPPSREKTLHANLGGHGDVPGFEVDGAVGFLADRLGLTERLS